MLRSIVVSVIILNAVSAKIHENVTESFDLNYLKNVLEIYEDFIYVIHFDGNSSDVANLLLEYLNEKLSRPSFVYAFDGKEYEAIRPNGTRLVNLVVCKNPWCFSSFLVDLRNIILWDVLIFVVYDDTVQFTQSHNRFWTMNYLELSGNVIIIDVRCGSSIKVYNVCYYCGDKSNVLNMLQENGRHDVEIEKSQLLPKIIKNFQKHFFTIAYLNYFPYMFCKKIEEDEHHGEVVLTCTEPKGIEAMALKELSAVLNFTYKLLHFNGTKRSYTYVMDKVINRSVDFAIGGITRTTRRQVEATFTSSFAFEDYTSLYLYKIRTSNLLLSYLLTFSVELWFVIISIVIFLSLFLYVTINIHVRLNDIKISYYRCLMVSYNIFIKKYYSLV